MIPKVSKGEGLSVLTKGDGFIEALVPRGLVGSRFSVEDAPVNAEGLVPLRIVWEKGVIVSINSIQFAINCPLKLLLPRLIEPHAHIDKAFTWGKYPNLSGTYDGALKTNLQEYKSRTIKELRVRVENSLKLAIKNGLRAMRSHVDSFGLEAENTWDALIDLKQKWSDLIELQFVALVPLEFWNSQHGLLFASKIAREGGIIGAVILPPFNKKRTYKLISKMLTLANKLQCPIDLHIDESDKYPAAGLKVLVDVLDNNDVNIPITCSHSSSMSLLPYKELIVLAKRLAEHKINVVALPLTNSWLLGRSPKKTPVKRAIAPIRQLQEVGVNVCVGGDNVQDPWFPGGNFDPIALMSFSMPIAQLAPWNRLGLAPFTSAPTFMMGLKKEGIIDVGNSAEFIVLDANSWVETLSSPPLRKIMINGSWLDASTISIQKKM